MTDTMPAASEQDFIRNLIPGYGGVAQTWECDLMGHLNVSHFFGRASDHASFTRHALGMAPSAMVAADRGTVALEEHGRFHREVVAGTTMIGRSAPIEIGPRTMQIYHEFRDPQDRLQACFKTLIGHFDTANRKLVPWTDKTLALAEAARIELPAHAALRFVPEGTRLAPMTREDSLAAGFERLGGTTVNSWECDQFGHMNTMFYIRRQTEVARYLWHRIGIDLDVMNAQGSGFVVGEMRVSYVSEVREGDIVETYSGIREVTDKSALVEHRLFNAETGALSSLALVRVMHFDLTTRRAADWSPAHKGVIGEIVVRD